ncbi:hypothetical protein [Methylotuvimicrobium sp. KM2]|uniref:hypothetical protein n=1 Tax=Methylotuvimicrobium sp. KM2 TaxID=3133976 RepID=UPI003100EEBE
MNTKFKKPPYSRDIARFKHSDEIIVCTGSNAWQAARRETWQPRTSKIVLPFGDDPAAYRWPVSGRYVQCWTCGTPEDDETILRLTRVLLESGAIKVLLLDPEKPLVVVEPVTMR